jgi:hypothetical protein
MLAATYQKLAIDLEKLIATSAIVDDERDKRLMSLLGSDDEVEHLDEVANLLGPHGRQDKTL